MRQACTAGLVLSSAARSAVGGALMDRGTLTPGGRPPTHTHAHTPSGSAQSPDILLRAQQLPGAMHSLGMLTLIGLSCDAHLPRAVCDGTPSDLEIGIVNAAEGDCRDTIGLGAVCFFTCDL